MAAKSCFGSPNCFVLFFLDIFLPTSWILLLNNYYGLLTQSQLEGSETPEITLNRCSQKNRPKTIYYLLGAGLQHNLRSGGIKAVFVLFQVSKNKDRR